MTLANPLCNTDLQAPSLLLILFFLKCWSLSQIILFVYVFTCLFSIATQLNVAEEQR